MEELLFLKSRAQALSVRLDRLNRRISSLQQGPGTFLSVAVVDPQKCLGCGLCERACPVGAISVNEAASVEPERCIGCGGCISQCPQGAIRLHPATLSREGRPRYRPAARELHFIKTEKTKGGDDHAERRWNRPERTGAGNRPGRRPGPGRRNRTRGWNGPGRRLGSRAGRILRVPQLR